MTTPSAWGRCESINYYVTGSVNYALLPSSPELTQICQSCMNDGRLHSRECPTRLVYVQLLLSIADNGLPIYHWTITITTIASLRLTWIPLRLSPVCLHVSGVQVVISEPSVLRGHKSSPALPVTVGPSPASRGDVSLSAASRAVQREAGDVTRLVPSHRLLLVGRRRLLRAGFLLVLLDFGRQRRCLACKKHLK